MHCPFPDTLGLMSTESPHILVVDDDADILRAAQMLLRRHGMAVVGAATPEAAWIALAQQPADVVLLDLNFARGRTSGEEGFAVLDRLLAADRDAVVIVVTGHSGIAVAVRAMRAGAADFVIKPWSNERLLTTVERGVALRRARRAFGTNGRAIVRGVAPACASMRSISSRPSASGPSFMGSRKRDGVPIGRPRRCVFVELRIRRQRLLLPGLDVA